MSATVTSFTKAYEHFGPFGAPITVPTSRIADGKKATKYIPTIDISALRSTNQSERARLAKEIFTVCQDVGFFYASEHGIENEIIENARSQVKQFFALPMKNKMSAHWHLNQYFMGYEAPFEMRHERQGQGDMKEGFSYQDEKSRQNIWPSGQDEFRSALNAYHDAMHNLAQLIHPLFAMAIGESEDYFAKSYGPVGTGVRMLHYPTQPASREADEVGIGAHTDYGLFTFLSQDGDGLMAQNETGEWIAVPPKEGTLVVNLADSLQWMSGGKLKSTRHRVMNTCEKERYCMAFFVNPNNKDIIRIAPSCQGNSEFRGEYCYEEYSAMRSQGSRLSHPMFKRGSQ